MYVININLFILTLICLKSNITRYKKNNLTNKNDLPMRNS